MPGFVPSSIMGAPRIAGRSTSIGALLAGQEGGTRPWEPNPRHNLYFLYYSLDRGQTWQPLASGLCETTLTHAWTIPEGTAGNVMVRIFQDQGLDGDARPGAGPSSLKTAPGPTTVAASGGTSIRLSWKAGQPVVQLDLERPARVDIDGVDPQGRVLLDWIVSHLEAGTHRLALPHSYLPMATTLRIRMTGKARLPR